jgi:magnesium transporter
MTGPDNCGWRRCALFLRCVQADHLNQPIARFASGDFTALPVTLTVGGALERIRDRGVGEKIIYFYVVDSEGRLVGVVPTRRLLTSPLDSPLTEVMISRVVTIPDTSTVFEVCEMFLMHKFLAFPVVDPQRRIVGVVNVSLFADEVLDLSEKSHLNDVFQTIGLRVAEVQSATPVRAFRLRFPWLVSTLLGGLCCAILTSLFEATLATSLVLAFFLTLVLGLGESVSAQSLGVALQSLHGNAAGWDWFARAVRKEFAVALMLGGTCAVVVGSVAWLWRGSAGAATVIAVSVALAMVMACLIGFTVPMILHRLKLDPRIAAGPLTLALADICTLVFYFSLATVILGRE